MVAVCARGRRGKAGALQILIGQLVSLVGFFGQCLSSAGAIIHASATAVDAVGGSARYARKCACR